MSEIGEIVKQALAIIIATMISRLFLIDPHSFFSYHK